MLLFLIFFSPLFNFNICQGAEKKSDIKQCLIYGDRNVELYGVISASPFRWPEKERIDHYSSFTLHLKEPFCTLRGNDNLEVSYNDIENVELGIIDAVDYRAAKGMVGSHVQCAGYLQPAISGYHVNSIILWKFTCKK